MTCNCEWTGRPAGVYHDKACPDYIPSNERLAEEFLSQHSGWQRLEKICVTQFAQWLDQRPSDETPQPASKEWIYCPECGSTEIHYEEGRHKQCAECHQEWFSDLDYTDVVRANLSDMKKRRAHETAVSPTREHVERRAQDLRQTGVKLIANSWRCEHGAVYAWPIAIAICGCERPSQETAVLHEGIRQSYLKALELSSTSGMLGDGDKSDLLELYRSLWPRAPSDVRENALKAAAPQCNGLCQGQSSEASTSGWLPDAGCPVHGVVATILR